ncbi:hypothetical protein M8I35_26800 [Micromonospora sp. MSM11]|nr:hypothetical protein [Micromonospora sp. MSM11]MCL7460782.1 hypothetical protein [Micromonospora sp. MSM11]
MTEQERNVEVVRRHLRTFVTKDLAELRAVVDEDVPPATASWCRWR